MCIFITLHLHNEPLHELLTSAHLPSVLAAGAHGSEVQLLGAQQAPCIVETAHPQLLLRREPRCSRRSFGAAIHDPSGVHRCPSWGHPTVSHHGSSSWSGGKFWSHGLKKSEKRVEGKRHDESLEASAAGVGNGDFQLPLVSSDRGSGVSTENSSPKGPLLHHGASSPTAVQQVTMQAPAAQQQQETLDVQSLLDEWTGW